MNFLLYMIGRSQRQHVTLRPSQVQLMRRQVASALSRGDVHGALEVCRELANEAGGTPADTLVRAHLHLAVNDYPGAETFFGFAFERLGDAPTFLDRIIEAAEGHLKTGRYVRAIELFQQGRGALDTLLAAQAGLAVAKARLTSSADPAAAGSALLPLAKLGDLLLRMVARAHLASNLAVCLRERRLREDLASWATNTASVENLLVSQYDELRENVAAHPQHAELHYRLGLVARTLGHFGEAAEAFSQVVAFHPHHLVAAARLAATWHQLGDGKRAAILPTLAVAFAAPAEVLSQYAALAAAATNAAAFDGAAQKLCLALPPAARAAAKANLAFALSDLGMLDSAHADWREPAAT